MRIGRPLTLLGAIFGVVGLVLLGVGVALAVSSASFLSSAGRADGTVVDMTERITTKPRNSDGHRRRESVWYPTVEFSVGGRTYTFRDSTGSNPPSYATGESVPVAYDPGDPADARIASFSSGFLGPLIVGGLGLLFTPVGAVLFVRGRRGHA
ncbi:DUF3592 domain-containing protein [Nonomuraea sp. ATR24]|uniref:DUF3592 domain-containing protein n=1 Tax=unclassified Nonomuraea TaxID=2593643 RepID=UPI0033CA9E1B